MSDLVAQVWWACLCAAGLVVLATLLVVLALLCWFLWAMLREWML